MENKGDVYFTRYRTTAMHLYKTDAMVRTAWCINTLTNQRVLLLDEVGRHHQRPARARPLVGVGRVSEWEEGRRVGGGWLVG